MLKPKNPFVVPALKRQAGSHEKSAKQTRLSAKRHLQQYLAQLKKEASDTN